MANPTWPALLPVPSDQSLSYTALVEPVQTTSMETGAPKRRRRFSAVPETFACTLVLTKAQVSTLKQFVQNTLADVLPFDWKDFRDGTAITYVFAKRPVYTLAAAGADLWQVQLELNTVP